MKSAHGLTRADRIGEAARRSHALLKVVDVGDVSAHTVATADGRRSAKTLTEYHNRYRGQRAVIIGNGPSLRDTDMSLLKTEITFGLNRVYLAFDELGFETTFVVAVNELVISQVADELAAVRAQKFLRWSCRSLLPDRAGNTCYVQSRRRPGFAGDARWGVWEGATVTYVAMQLAFHMGFAEVVLVGVDHRFATNGPAHSTVQNVGPDRDHFRADYFGRGFRWQLPDLETSEYAYRLAREAYEKSGRRIIDATVGGKLDIFPKRDLAEAIA